MDTEVGEARRRASIQVHMVQPPSKDLGFFGFLEKLLLPGALGVLAYFANAGANEIAKGQLALASEAQERQQAEAAAQRQLKVLELVYQDIVSGDRTKQTTALELTQRLDPMLANALTQSVAKNENLPAAVRDRAAKAASAVQQFSPLYDYKIGIYYRSSDRHMESRAEDIRKGLQAQGLPNIVVLNPRDDGFFAATGQPQGNEVRFEAATETVPADSLLAILQALAPDAQFRKREVVNRTPGFLSLYLK